MVKGKDLTKFVRFGTLDLIKQKGYGKDSFHAPPAPRGVFAMPFVLQELFLVSSLDKTQSDQWPKGPVFTDDEDPEYESKKESYHAFNWNEHQKRRDFVFSSIRKEFKKKEGHIWHHLGDYVKQNEVVARHNAWVKTSISAWKKAVSKQVLEHKYGGYRGERGHDSVNQSRLTGWFSRDHFEVFFDEKNILKTRELALIFVS